MYIMPTLKIRSIWLRNLKVQANTIKRPIKLPGKLIVSTIAYLFALRILTEGAYCVHTHQLIWDTICMPQNSSISKVVSQGFPIHSQSGTLANMTNFRTLSMGKSEVGLVDQTKWNQKDKRQNYAWSLFLREDEVCWEKKNKSKFKSLHPEPTWKLVSGVTVQCTVSCRMEDYFPASTRGHGEWVNGLGEFGVRDVRNELFRLFWSSQFRLKQTSKQTKKPPDPTASAEVWSDSIFRMSSHSGKINRTGLGLCVKKQSSDRTVSNCWPTGAPFESVARNENSEAFCF